MAAPAPSPAVRIAAARHLASGLPALMVAARQVAAAVQVGWHGRRRPGSGEEFWQFRPFRPGEPARVVDWRRSARGDDVFVRERELQNAHTVWLHADTSASMAFRSAPDLPPKGERALLITLALAEMLARSGERTGVAGRPRALWGRNAMERLAPDLVAPDGGSLPGRISAARHHEVVLAGDFLDDPQALLALADDLSARGARLHLVQVLDPAEESFDYRGRVEFRDPETGARYLAGKAESLAADYRAALAGLRDRLAGLGRRAGWSFTVHRTDRPATSVLLALAARLSAGGAGGAA